MGNGKTQQIFVIWRYWNVDYKEEKYKILKSQSFMKVEQILKVEKMVSKL